MPVSNSASLPFARGYLALIGQGLLSMSKLVGNQLPIGTELIRDCSAGALQLTRKPVTTSTAASCGACERGRETDEAACSLPGLL